MADSRRELIMKNVETVLGTISIVNDYINDIGLVTRAAVNDPSQAAVPILYVQQGDEMAITSMDDGETPFNIVSRTLSVRILIIHRHDPVADAKSTDEVLNSIQQDIYKAMMLDHTRGALAIDTTLRKTTGAMELEATVEGALKLIEFDVKYRHNWQDESVAA